MLKLMVEVILVLLVLLPPLVLLAGAGALRTPPTYQPIQFSLSMNRLLRIRVFQSVVKEALMALLWKVPAYLLKVRVLKTVPSKMRMQERVSSVLAQMSQVPGRVTL